MPYNFDDQKLPEIPSGSFLILCTSNFEISNESKSTPHAWIYDGFETKTCFEFTILLHSKVVWCFETGNFETFFYVFEDFFGNTKANPDVVRKLDFVTVEWHQNHAITLFGCGDIA